MDTVGLERASLLGYSEGGMPAAMFAATYPRRCAALVLLETAAKADWAPDHLPELRTVLDRFWQLHEDATEHWGTGTWWRRGLRA